MIDTKCVLMAENMSSFQHSSHDDSSLAVGAHSHFPSMDFDSFAFLCSREVVSYVGSSEQHAPVCCCLHCNCVRSHEEVIAEDMS